MTDTVRFDEKQQFRSKWLWLLLLIAAAPAWVIFVVQVIGGRPIGSEPAPDWALWIFFLLIGVGLLGLFWWMRLEVTVTDAHLRIRFRPFRAKVIPHDQIAGAEAVTYSPLGEFGGWGLRYRPGFGWAYNISGKQGVIVTLEDGRTMLIGSQRHEELAHALEVASDKPVA